MKKCMMNKIRNFNLLDKFSEINSDTIKNKKPNIVEKKKKKNR